MKVLKFMLSLTALHLTYVYVPYGSLIVMAVGAVALWKLVND